MPGSNPGAGHENAEGRLATLAETIRGQCREMEPGQRAFLIYCVLRLRGHREEREPQQIKQSASGRDTTGTISDAGTSSY